MYSRTAGSLLISAALVVFFSPFATAQEQPLSALEHGLSEVVYGLSQTIVTVESSHHVSEGNAQESLCRIVSSGVVYDSAGLVLVSAATVAGQERIIVTYQDKTVRAELVGIDNLYGVALIRSLQPVGVPVRLAESHVCAGQMIIAMGNAFGVRASPSLGFCAGIQQDGQLQFTAPISAGTIGGGVYDLDSKLQGLIVGRVGEQNPAAVAIPAFRIPSIVNYLLKFGVREAGFIGITTVEIEISPPLETVRRNRLAAAGQGKKEYLMDRGLLITKVLPYAPAGQAGIREGDLLFSIDGKRVSQAPELAFQVGRSQPGSTIILGLIRNNQLRNVQLTVGRKEQKNRQSLSDRASGHLNNKRLADSLASVLQQLKDDILRVESRLNELK